MVGDEAEERHEKSSCADAQAEGDPGGGAGVGREVILSEFDEDRERDISDEPDDEYQRQRAVLVATCQQGDQGGDEEGVAELHSPGEADTRADAPPASVPSTPPPSSSVSATPPRAVEAPRCRIQ